MQTRRRLRFAQIRILVQEPPGTRVVVPRLEIIQIRFGVFLVPCKCKGIEAFAALATEFVPGVVLVVASCCAGIAYNDELGRDRINFRNPGILPFFTNMQVNNKLEQVI